MAIAFLIVAALFCFWFFTSLMLPWLVRGQVSYLRNELEHLRRRVASLEKEKAPAIASPMEASPAVLSPEPVFSPPPQSKPVAEPAAALPEESLPKEAWAAYKTAKEKFPKTLLETVETAQMRIEPEPPKKSGFEFQFGAKLPVWVGGIALVLAGFYLVKYSIDIGLLTPAVRLFLGTLFGGGLLGMAYVIRQDAAFADGTRISQALAGAGIADLYICVYAATNICQLISPTLGFAGMAAVTAMAVLLSLRHGAPIAALGMIGGFVTPALMSSDHPSAVMLFGYLYLVLAGLMAAIRRQGWWTLALLTVAASFVWVLLWVMGAHFVASDALWLALFLLAVTGTVFGLSNKDRAETADEEAHDVFARPVPLLNNAVAFGALVLFGIVISKSGYGLMEWGLFWLLSAATLAMAAFRFSAYRPLPWISLAMNGLMLGLYYHIGIETSPLILFAFALLYVIGAYVLQERGHQPFYWGAVALSALMGFFTLAYFKMTDLFTAGLWGQIALALGTVVLYGIQRIMTSFAAEHPGRPALLTLYVSVATAFFSAALMILLDRFYLPLAFAGEVLTLSFIAARTNLPNLKWITAAATGVFIFLSLPAVITGIALVFHALFESSPYVFPLEKPLHPLIQLGLPALCFFGAALQWLRRQDGPLVNFFEGLGLFLISLAIHYTVERLLPAAGVMPGFAMRGIVTNIFFAGGFICLLIGERFNRTIFMTAAQAFTLAAAFRTGLFEFLTHNPVWYSDQHVGATPLFNATLINYGAPALWLIAFAKRLPFSQEAWVKPIKGFAMVLLLSLLNVQVRQVFHGDVLTGKAENIEVYTYSALWLVTGLGLLFYGTLRRIQALRTAALALIVLTVGKVFLYDASELTGLYRVFSFLGLGFSLLGLSWFYTRFILPQTKE